MTKLKKGPLGKAETFYIENHRDKLTEKEIAKDLNRTITSVKEYISTLPETPTLLSEQFARQSGATIMTENASSMSDETSQTKQIDKSHCVTKIK